MSTERLRFQYSPWFQCALSVLILVLIGLTGCQTTSHSSATAAGQLTFVQKKMGPVTQLQRVSPTGSSGPVLVSERWRDLQPHWSPQGTLVFMSNRHGRDQIHLDKDRERLQIFLLDPGNAEPELISDTDDSAVSPRFSRSGGAVAYIHARPGNAALEVVELDTRVATPVTRARDILDYAWAPDGRALVVAVFNPGRSRLEFVAAPGERDPELPDLQPEERGSVITGVSWSPDGSAVAYIVNSPDRARRLYLYDLKTGQRRRLSNPEHHVQNPVQWSADGDDLLYAALVDFDFHYDEAQREQVYEGSMQIFLSDRSGNARQLTQGEGRHGAPVFSPDGRRIGFLFAETLDARTLSVRTMDLEGREVRELHQRVAPESLLQWN